MYEGSMGRIERFGRTRTGVRAERVSVRRFDPILVLVAFALTAAGNVIVFSATKWRLLNAKPAPLPTHTFLNKQLVFSVAGVAVMVFMASFSYRRLKAWAPFAYVTGIVLLLAVLTPVGSSVKGAQRWISLGFFQLQPSEFMKLSMLIVLAMLMAEHRGDAGLREVGRAALLVAPAAALIFLQPDLGTLLVLLALLIAALVIGGTRLHVLLLLIVVGTAGVFGVFHSGVMHDYQKARLTAFLHPEDDPTGVGYNLTQARIGVGSGELTGKGLFSDNATQTNRWFVPEVHTDFIFVALAEQTGFFGAMVMLLLFAIFLWRGLRIAIMSKDLFGTLLASGVVAMIAFQVFVNVGMTIGISPITGIPLPFISYGGSSMVTTYAATGILLNVHMRRGV
jgi:rod shape determining protein RodA